VAKVKKVTGVTGERNKTGKTARARKNGTKKAVGTRSTSMAVGRRSKKTATSPKKRAVKTKKGAVKTTKAAKGVKAVASLVRVAVKSLDPLRKCGPKTTVQFLYRVDESVDGRNTPHLVFFDRHGWYCEHGRSCPAVGHARKFNGQIARAS